MKFIDSNIIVLVALPLFVCSSLANAEVYKCKNPSGKIIYQAEPCSTGAISQGVVDVKALTPEEAEAANQKLRTWQEQQANEEAAKKERYKERQAEMERQESLRLQRRSVQAQERATAAQQQQQYNNGPLYVPAYDFNRYNRFNRLYPPHGGWDPYQYPRPRPYDGMSPYEASQYPPYKRYVEPPPPPFRASKPIPLRPHGVNPGQDSFGYPR